MRGPRNLSKPSRVVSHDFAMDPRPADGASTGSIGSLPRSPNRVVPFATDRRRGSLQPAYQPMSFGAMARSPPNYREALHHHVTDQPLGMFASAPQQIGPRSSAGHQFRDTLDPGSRPMVAIPSKSERHLASRLASVHLSPPKFNALGQTLSPPGPGRRGGFRGSLSSPSSPIALSPPAHPYARVGSGSLPSTPPTPRAIGGNMPLPILSMASSFQHGAGGPARSRMVVSPGGESFARYGMMMSQANYNAATGAGGGGDSGMLGLASLRSNRGLVPPGVGSGDFIQGRRTPSFVALRAYGSPRPAGMREMGNLGGVSGIESSVNDPNGLSGIGGSWRANIRSEVSSLNNGQRGRASDSGGILHRGALQLPTPAPDEVAPIPDATRNNTQRGGPKANAVLPGMTFNTTAIPANPSRDIDPLRAESTAERYPARRQGSGSAEAEGYPFLNVAIPTDPALESDLPLHASPRGLDAIPIIREPRRGALVLSPRPNINAHAAPGRTNVFGLDRTTGSGTGTPFWAGKTELEGYKIGVGETGKGESGTRTARLGQGTGQAVRAGTRAGQGFKRPLMTFERDGEISPGTVPPALGIGKVEDGSKPSGKISSASKEV